MTLAQAERIVSIVSGLVASGSRTGMFRKSQIGSWSLCDISNAFALVIAKNRQIWLDGTAGRRRCKEYADKAGALVVSLRMIVVPDEQLDALARLEQGTATYSAARGKIIQQQLDDESPEWQKFLKLEALDSFDNYCWTLSPTDPLYWQKIYTHIDLPYDETSPKGEPELAMNDQGNVTLAIKTGEKGRDLSFIRVIFWVGLAVVIVWLWLKHL